MVPPGKSHHARRSDDHQASSVRSSHSAGSTIVRADTDPNADASARKMPPSERSARQEEQRTRLAGLSLDGVLDVAHCVLDAVMSMLETDQLRYLPPSKYISRSQEIMALKPHKELRLDAKGSGIQVRDAAPDLECPTGTELEVLHAMTRRSLAFDCAGVIEYSIAQKWATDLFSIMQQPVAPGFMGISLIQLLRTDRMAFNRMCELTKNGVKPTSAGIRPLDSIMSRMREDSSVMFYMLPTLAIAKNPSPKRTWEDAFSVGKGKGRKGDKGKGKGKAKTKRMSTAWNAGRLPEELRKNGCVAADNQGRRRCFAYNLGGCDKAQPGEQCERGWHLCARKGCGQPHPQRAHPSK